MRIAAIMIIVYVVLAGISDILYCLFAVKNIYDIGAAAGFKYVIGNILATTPEPLVLFLILITDIFIAVSLLLRKEKIAGVLLIISAVEIFAGNILILTLIIIANGSINISTLAHYSIYAASAILIMLLGILLICRSKRISEVFGIVLTVLFIFAFALIAVSGIVMNGIYIVNNIEALLMHEYYFPKWNVILWLIQNVLALSIIIEGILVLSAYVILSIGKALCKSEPEFYLPNLLTDEEISDNN